MSRKTIMTEVIVCDLCCTDTTYYKHRCGSIISRGKFVADLCPECKGLFSATVAPFLLTHFGIDTEVVPLNEEEDDD